MQQKNNDMKEQEQTSLVLKVMSLVVFLLAMVCFWLIFKTYFDFDALENEKSKAVVVVQESQDVYDSDNIVAESFEGKNFNDTQAIEENATLSGEAVEEVAEEVEPVTEAVEDANQEVAESVDGAVEEVTEEVEPMTEAVENANQEVAESVDEAVEEVTEEVEPMTEAVEEANQEVVESVGEAIEEVVEEVESVTEETEDVDININEGEEIQQEVKLEEPIVEQQPEVATLKQEDKETEEVKPVLENGNQEALTTPVAGYVAIVVDDMGINVKKTKEVIAIQAPLTTSFLTYGSRLKEFYKKSKNSGHEIMIHAPM